MYISWRSKQTSRTRKICTHTDVKLLLHDLWVSLRCLEGSELIPEIDLESNKSTKKFLVACDPWLLMLCLQSSWATNFESFPLIPWKPKAINEDEDDGNEEVMTMLSFCWWWWLWRWKKVKYKNGEKRVCYDG